ncbi:MAG: carboxypeptidase-like regulatory domain-containing protein, partial [Muribaculaceae bacterium]|nr:carboxypeptidase-like regulatory domain-containing protein [Muribaculaceae bacterium]
MFIFKHHRLSGALMAVLPQLLSVIMFACAAADVPAAGNLRFKVTGEVTDAAGEPEIYATVRVYAEGDSVKAVSLGTTDEQGRFSQGLATAGNYRLTVASVGKTPITRDFAVSEALTTVDLGRLTATDASNELAEIEVVAQRPLVSREIDRLGY